MGARRDSPFAPMPAHAETEDDLRRSGVACTALRNGFYAATAVQLMGQALTTGQLVAPEDGPVSWTAHADLADAAALALDGALDGVTAPLTGPQALDFGDIAALASELTGRDITRVTVADDEWTAGMVARGVPEGGARMLLGMFLASRRGDFAAVDPALGELLGRPATTFAEVLAASTGG
ncbi:hypothetical protein GCM10017691_18130 [Pseudonocardia petroleophila]